MDNNFLMNSSIPPQLQYDHPFSSTIYTWQSLATSMEIQTTHPQDYFHSTPPPTDHFVSPLSSMVSSPTASNSAFSTDSLMIKELIGKLNNICNYNGGNCSTNTSCYSTPLSSLPKMSRSMPIIDHLAQENFPSLGNSFMLSSNLPAMPGDPGFAERAAMFSSFGSTTNNQFGDFVNRSCSNLGGRNGNLQSVSSCPSLNKLAKGSQVVNNNKKNSMNERKQYGNSSISEQNQIRVVEIGSNRKRKAASSMGKGKEIQSQSQIPTTSTQVGENEGDSNAKKSRSEESNSKKGGAMKAEENKEGYDNQKPNEPPKDYIHVRARRGQATDSHSLAERVRREKISEKMKLLQDIVPGCNRVTGKAPMLDEIINYVQSLQRQVEFLSMKLSTVNPRLELLNMNNLFSKDEMEPNLTLAQPMYMYPTNVPTQYGQPNQNLSQDSSTTTGAIDPLNHSLNHNHLLHLSSIHDFSNYLPQGQVQDK